LYEGEFGITATWVIAEVVNRKKKLRPTAVPILALMAFTSFKVHLEPVVKRTLISSATIASSTHGKVIAALDFQTTVGTNGLQFHEGCTGVPLSASN
jgi:hypothetical protein